jgi:hypothetical protein
MSLKNKVGNFLILFGLIGLIIFIASVLAPPESFDTTAFLMGAAFLAVGVNFRRSRVRPRAGGPPPGAAAPVASERPAAPAGAPPKPAKRGLFSTILKGPANKQKGAGGSPAAAGGGKPSGGGKGAAGGGKAGGGGGKGGPGGKGGGGRK